MSITIYSETGCDGKLRKFIYGKGYYQKIYKQYSRTPRLWLSRLENLLIKANFNKKEIYNIIHHCFNRGYYITNNYYIKPEMLVQRILDLGYDNLECV